jgi:hypothetical protein
LAGKKPLAGHRRVPPVRQFCAAARHKVAQRLGTVYKVAMAKKNPAAVSPSDVSRVMAAMGRKGGTATAENRTPEQRAKSARAAAKARWAKPRKPRNTV